MKIETPSRLHITLIDLNASLGRMDGGLGIALERPRIKLRAVKSSGIAVKGSAKERYAKAAKRVISHLGIEGGIDITVEEAFPQHIGLGSGTQIALAAGSAVVKLYGAELGVRDIAGIVGRGGTSGIGVAAFEKGGFILDGGHSLKVKKDFMPSSASRAPPPAVVVRHDFPDWRLALIIPREGASFAGAREVDVFKKYCPIPLAEVQKLSHIILMKILPAVVEEDIEAFGEGINMVQKVGFKRIEIELQDPKMRRLLSIAQEHSYGAGLSSFGPVIYSLPRHEDRLLENIPTKEAEVIFTKASHKGARFRS
ncbi:MAG: beta-ribofuranosylaminobenzene 5'-phosphate synthase [Candidatus Hydrothermarchaeaceae archaeon]